MSAETYRLQREIARQENHLADLEARQRQLEARLSDLNQLQARFDRIRTTFESRQRARRNALGNVVSRTAVSRAARTYHAGMTALLSGVEYSNASNGLAEGVRVIRRESNSTFSKLESVRREIRQVRRRIDSLHYQLHLAQLAELQQS